MAIRMVSIKGTDFIRRPAILAWFNTLLAATGKNGIIRLLKKSKNKKTKGKKMDETKNGYTIHWLREINSFVRKTLNYIR
jgi:hypothetical protein